jgi:hypothetical protein
MSDYAFFLELTSLLRNAVGEFKAKPNDWHSHLASILIRLPQTYSSQLASLPLVPLSDGSWMAARGRQILFPSTMAEFELPGGLKLSVVHSGAAADPKRRNLFKLLGVGDLNKKEPIIRHIQDLHISNRTNSSSLSRAALISQIKFLYSMWKNPTFQWF